MSISSKTLTGKMIEATLATCWKGFYSSILTVLVAARVMIFRFHV